MLLIFGIAAAAAVAVVAYNRLRERNPGVATAALRTVHQLAAVILVISKAVEGVVEALQSSVRPRYTPVTRGYGYGGYDLEEEEEE